MSTNKTVVEGPKLEPVDGDLTVNKKVIQVGAVQTPAAPAPVKVVPSASTPKPTPSVTVQASSTPVVLASKVNNTGTQQVTKATLNPGVQVSPSPAPGRTVLITVPRTAATQPVTVAPRKLQAASTQLPANIQIPPGMMLIRSDSGQLMLVSQQALAHAQQAPRVSSGPPTPRILTPPPTPSPAGKTNDKVTMIRMSAPTNIQSTPVQKTTLVKVISVPPKPAVVQTLSTVTDRSSQPRIFTVPEPKKEPTPTFSQEMLESVKKCKNFLVTLMKLASSDSANMADNVRGLVRSLLEGKLEVEEFTEQLYCTLKSTPQPCLVPFLKKSLPAVRALTPDAQFFIQQASISTKTSGVKQSTSNPGQSSLQQKQTLVMQPPRSLPAWLAQSKARVLPKQSGLQSAKHFTGSFSMKQSYDQPSATVKGTAGSYKEDDDINDVASMAGVNLREENAQILTTKVGSVVQSCQDQPFLAPNPLLTQILQAGQPLGVTEVGLEVVALVSHATLEFLRSLLEKLSVMAHHRKNLVKEDWFHTKVSDVRAQLRFLEDMEALRKKRKDEEERDRLLRLARSRAHMLDPEMQLLKQRAKELQQLEQAQLLQREANLTALAAIGPRRKRPLETPEGQICVLPRPGVQRVTRIILRDLLQCMEQDRFLRHSLTLYRAMQ